VNGTDTSPRLETLLAVVFHHRIMAPDAETGIAQLAAIANQDNAVEAWHKVVSEAIAAGYVYDPVRLNPGALQCHWHLELTPQGVEAARHLRSSEATMARSSCGKP